MPQSHNLRATTHARHAGLDPASRFSIGDAFEGGWTPDQVRGDEIEANFHAKCPERN